MNFDSFLQPAIFGLTGKPGAGKSYFATRLIIDEITKGQNRTIVTNVPVNRARLEKYCKKTFNIYDLETFSNNRHFFTNRGHYKFEITDANASIDFSDHLQDDDDGVLFIIDEAHLYFNSREWKNMSKATLSYITFIRHVGDTLIWMCQKYSDIDSQFRGKTQAFHVLRNLDKEKFGFGWLTFKRGTGFRCYQYLEENHIASHGSSSGQPAQDFTYPFKLEIAECYSTSLFNKEHEKRFKVRGLNIQYLIWGGGIALVAAVIWAANGGLPKMMSYLIPTAITEEAAENISAKVETPITLPAGDPFTAPPPSEFWHEVPTFFNTSGGKNERTGSPWELLDPADYKRKKDYWFGENRKCKITFISDKVTKENSAEFSFAAVWKNFSQINNIKLSQEAGLWQMSTEYFTGFLTFVRESGNGANMKETDIILKENVPFKLVHGYQLPYQTSYATQGVVRSSQDYRDVGFSLELELQAIDDKEMLKISVNNSDVMDITSIVPIMQTFQSENILDVKNGMTYQIADFRSVTSQVTKGILKKRDYSTEVTNKIFISYGNY